MSDTRRLVLFDIDGTLIHCGGVGVRGMNAAVLRLPGVGGSAGPGPADALALGDEVGVGLLTGNFERGAALKLGYFDLWGRFAFGAFGDGHVDRRDLVPVAIAAASRAGFVVPASQVVVIGDTPADVECARA